jgi:glycerol transport system permease protein
MMQSQSKWALILVLPACLLLAVIGLLPLLAVVNYGFHDIFSLSDVHWVGFDWFADILGSDRFLASLGRSLLFSALTLAIQLPLGIAVALMLLGFGRFAIWGLMLTALHTWALILVMDTWHWLGLVVILSYAGLSAIPPQYRQAAVIDGASRWAIFRHIELPRLSGALAIVILIRFVDSFMIYTEAFTINAGGPNDATRFLSLELGEEIKGFSYGQAAARATLYFLIVLAVTYVFVVVTRRQEDRP